MNFVKHCNAQDADDDDVGKKPLVVLIDDHMQSLQIGKKHLTRDGFDVIEFNSGAKFLAELPKITPDIILLLDCGLLNNEVSG